MRLKSMSARKRLCHFALLSIDNVVTPYQVDFCLDDSGLTPLHPLAPLF
jgi:hypothetical protein